MMTFDRVLPDLIRICKDFYDTRADISCYCITRDVRGRVRLIVQPKEKKSIDLSSLEADLNTQLGAYFVGPVLLADGKGEMRHLAIQLLEKSKGKWPTGWPTSIRNILGGADTSLDTRKVWTGIERMIGKESWLEASPPEPPWPLIKAQPTPIVTFHSFKGGVGRTTLVASYAILLASRPQPLRVAVVDLDLEAPGIGSLFGVSTERGVLDVLVDHIATGEVDLNGASSKSMLNKNVDEWITVFPAGSISDLYIQKLARLDFSSTEPGKENPVGAALSAMLKAMKRDFDIILLDARAGLHDLSGISLHRLAHVDVLVFRGTSQNLAGLDQTLRTLGKRDTPLVLVETLLPSNDEELFKLRRDRTRLSVYEMLAEHSYPEEDPPQLADIGLAHDVCILRRKDWLEGIDSLKDHVADVQKESELIEVARRISIECLPEATTAEPSPVQDEMVKE